MNKPTPRKGTAAALLARLREKTPEEKRAFLRTWWMPDYFTEEDAVRVLRSRNRLRAACREEGC